MTMMTVTPHGLRCSWHCCCCCCLCCYCRGIVQRAQAIAPGCSGAWKAAVTRIGLVIDDGWCRVTYSGPGSWPVSGLPCAIASRLSCRIVNGPIRQSLLRIAVVLARCCDCLARCCPDDSIRYYLCFLVISFHGPRRTEAQHG